MPSAALVAARMDRLPVTRLHKLALLTLAFVFLFEFGDLNTFAYVAPALKEHLRFTVADIAVVTSAAFVGMALGASLGGRLSDHIGRKRALVLSTLVFSVFSLLNALGYDIPSFFAFRLLTGAGLSAMVVAATTYISEVMPASRRGRMQSAVMAIGLAGIPCMSFLARGIIPLGHDAWRLVFVAGSLALAAVPALLTLPESPRWLQHKGRHLDAEAVLAKFEHHAPRLDPVDATTLAPETESKPAFAQLFRGSVGRRTLFLAVVWIFQTLGFYGFVAWVPTLLAEQGFSLTQSLQFAALTTIGAIPGALLAWPVSDRFGRKVPLVIAALATAASGLAYGLTFNPIAIVIFGFCVNLLIQTFATLLYTYSPELFPTSLRNSGHGLVYGTGRLANIFGPVLVAAIFSTFGYQAVFMYIAACWLIVAFAVAFFGPRTGGLALEDVNQPAGVEESSRRGPVGNSVSISAPARHNT